MKYLTVVYYDTFARFFSAIEDEVRTRDSEAEFLHLALFPSAYLYMLSEKRTVRLLPWEATKARRKGNCLRILRWIASVLTTPTFFQVRVGRRMHASANERQSTSTRCPGFFESFAQTA